MPNLHDCLAMPGVEGLTISGRVTRIGTRTSDTNEHGPWSMQTITIEDASGTMAVLLKNRPPVVEAEYLGREFVAESILQPRLNKKTGVKIEAFSFTGRTGAEVSGVRAVVTASANVITLPPMPGVPVQIDTRGASTPRLPSQPPAPLPVTTTQERFDRATASMHQLLDWASLEAANPNYAILHLTGAEWQGLISTLYIQLNRGN